MSAAPESWLNCAPQAGELFDPEIAPLLLQCLRDKANKLLSVGNSGFVATKLGVRRQVRSTKDRLRKEPKLTKYESSDSGLFREKVYGIPSANLFIVACTDHNKSILAWEDLVGNYRGMRSAVPTTLLSGDEVV